MKEFSASKSSRRSLSSGLIFLLATAMVAVACGVSSPAWCGNSFLTVADTGNDRIVFTDERGKVIASLTDLPSPVGVAPDSSNNLWVSVLGNLTFPAGLLEYSQTQLANLGKNPNPTPQAVLFGSIFVEPGGLAFNTQGTLWAADQSGSIFGFNSSLLSAGSKTNVTPSITITSSSFFNQPKFPVFDKNDNLWISDAHNFGKLYEFQASDLFSSGDKVPAVVLSDNGGSLNAPGQLNFDNKGNLWVPNSGDTSISIFGPGQLVTGAPIPNVTIESSIIDEPEGAVFSSGKFYTAVLKDDVVAVFGRTSKKKTPKVKVVISGLLNDPSQMGTSTFPLHH